MLDLIYFNESVFIYDIEDWDLVRREYRIIGEFYGSTQYIPVLPLQLAPEEALLLIEKGFARLVTVQETHPSSEEHNKFVQELIAAELAYYRKLRHKQVLLYIDKILIGKQKRGDSRSKDEIITEEVDKVKVTESNMIWPLILHKHNKETVEIVDKEVLLTQTTKVKYATFKELWNKQFYITSGAKFGGDFLVYNGDPLLYHGLYIVRCMQPEDKLHPTELIALGRICTSVKKKGLLSNYNSQTDEVNFITINWIDH